MSNTLLVVLSFVSVIVGFILLEVIIHKLMKKK
jgi:hypothetical protein